MEVQSALWVQRASLYGPNALSGLQRNQEIRKAICPDLLQQHSPSCPAPQFLAGHSAFRAPVPLLRMILLLNGLDSRLFKVGPRPLWPPASERSSTAMPA